MSEEFKSAMPDSGDTRKKQMMLLVGAGGILFVIMLGFLSFTEEQKKAQEVHEPETFAKKLSTPGSSLSAEDVWTAKNEKKIKTLEQQDAEKDAQIKSLQDTVASMRAYMDSNFAGFKADAERNRQLTAKELQDLKAKNNANNKSVRGNANLPKPPAVEKGFLTGLTKNDPPAVESSGNATRLPPLPLPSRSRPSSKPAVQEEGIFVVSLVDTTAETEALKKDSASKKKNANRKHVDSYIPSGTITKADLLGGLDAPTGGQAQGNPHPVLLRLKDNSILPNRWRAPTRECFVVAAGYGDLASERAYMRLEKLSCVLHDGSVIDKTIKGTIQGEDGKNGVQGTLVSKQGQLIARSFMAGLGSGFGESVSQSFGTTSISPLGSTTSVAGMDVFKQGAAKGVGNAFTRIADFYLDLAEKTFPIIEVSAGRTLTVMLTSGVDLGESLNEESHSEGGKVNRSMQNQWPSRDEIREAALRKKKAGLRTDG